ncbi:type IV pilus twitching motility protein PilT [Fusobacterium sp.]|uniref:type IV pilus twitching motility protein PilT n=1 Tax=Fusobacterium sp. TaxID=68766 RepID=UPI0025C3E360|nr:PilT/PilU family type 4a pilus ATPase [Fusobacterium sp.]
MLLENLLLEAREQRATDIHLVCEELPIFRLNGRIEFIGEERVDRRVLNLLVDLILNEREKNILYQNRDLDCSFEDSRGFRYRANFHWEKSNIAVSIRLIERANLSMEELGLPIILKELLNSKKGLILITGPSGSGKSTTLSAMIEELNESKALNIITLEDPIEYIFKSKKSLIRQREVGKDTLSFIQGLKSVLRQDPDVIMVGELRDRESIGAALTAAETGHLVLGTLHTNSASESINRITDVFPAEEQNEVRVKLASTLRGIVSQKLVNTLQGKRVGAYEILVSTPAISNLILNNKTNQINSIIELNRKKGMILMRNYLEELYSKKIISQEEYEENLK